MGGNAVIVAILLCFVLPGFGQAPVSAPTKVLVTITDKSGYPPEVELKDRIEIREDKILQKIESVLPASAVPIHVAIFMDESGRFAQYKNDEKKAVDVFLQHFVRNGVDKPYLLSFGQGATSMNSIRDYADYRAARNNNRVAAGENLLAGMVAFVNTLNQSFGEKFPDRRAVIIFSNGGAQVSIDELPRVRDYAVANRIAVFEVDTDRSQRFSQSTIRDIVEDTGGTIERPNNVAQFGDALNQMGKNISDQYEVTYDSTHPDGKMHSISIRSL
ncbi:MAG TPA: hypothetical protein VG897_07905, partial [Terriglobales bacterium]|nr:hypothetical protein [Terriglobales bacterium]